jgi:hypothetical protein
VGQQQEGVDCSTGDAEHKEDPGSWSGARVSHPLPMCAATGPESPGRAVPRKNTARNSGGIATTFRYPVVMPTR